MTRSLRLAWIVPAAFVALLLIWLAIVVAVEIGVQMAGLDPFAARFNALRAIACNGVRLILDLGLICSVMLWTCLGFQVLSRLTHHLIARSA